MDIVIFGADSMAEIVHFYVSRDGGHRVVAFIVDAEYLKEDRFRGLPVVAAEAVPSRFAADRCGAFVAVGYGRVNRLRAEKCAAMRAAGYALVSYVSPHAFLLSDYPLGWNCLVLERVAIQPRVRIGNNVFLTGGSSAAQGATIEDNVYVGRLAAIAGEAHIGANSFLGVGCVVGERVRVGRSCVVGAGAVLLHDADDDGVYAARSAEKSRAPSFRLRRL